MSKINLKEKRKKALEKLRKNRGKSQLALESLSEAVKENINLFAQIKEDEGKVELITDINLDEDEDENDSEINLENEEIINPQNLTKITQAQQKTEDKQAKIKASAQRLKETRAKIREIRQQKQQESSESDNQERQNLVENDYINRHQLKEDLLTVDFWQQASQWLSGINTDIHLSSTPPEEIELLYKQAKHRYKALQLMLEDTQRELDAFEVYFRNLESASQLENNQ